MKKKFFDIQRFSFIYNDEDNIIVTGTADADTIRNNGAYVTINGGAGDDSIQSGYFGKVAHLFNVIQYANGDGNDTVNSLGSKDTLQIIGTYTAQFQGNDLVFKVGEGSITLEDAKYTRINVIDAYGNATLLNGDWNVMEGTDGDDSLSNDVDNVTILGFAGNDYIHNIGNNVWIKIDGSADSEGYNISNYGYNATIYGGASDDGVYNVGNNALIDLGAGNDYIRNYGVNSAIYLGDGDDQINNRRANVTIYGGAGNDSISDSGDMSAINGGTGDDTIIGRYQHEGRLYQYSNGDGNDIIFGFSSNDTLQITGGDSTTVRNGNDIIVNVGSGSITIRDSVIANKFNDTFVVGTAGDDNIYNSGSNVTISSGDGNDSIIAWGSNVNIDGGAGDDTIESEDENGNNVTINGGDGNDELHNEASNAIVNGDGGNDYISNSYAVNVIINGGAGNDSIYIHSGDNVTVYGGDGNDTFYYSDSGSNVVIGDYQSSEIIKFNPYNYTGWGISGNNIAITVKDNDKSSSLRINDVRNKLIEIADYSGNVLVHAFLAENYEGVLDGKSFGEYEIIVGSDNLSNQIFAGNGGSSLWGGGGNANDELYGGAGYDEFVYNFGDGQDTIFNAGIEDVVNLNGVSFEQIIGAEITDNGVNAQFSDGGSLNINGQAGAFRLGGQTYHADYQAKTWS